MARLGLNELLARQPQRAVSGALDTAHEAFMQTPVNAHMLRNGRTEGS